MSERIRLDKYVQGLLGLSRSEAQAAIEAGKVSVNGATITKPAYKVSDEDEIEAARAHDFVSRAALKLDGALNVFEKSVEGLICLDVGSSTGGFTDVLLRRGAGKVFAVDVGRDQFHQSLRGHEKVRLFEQTDARSLTRDQIDQPIDLIVCDASFIGLEKVLQPALSFVTPGGEAILLFKPQFQVGPKHVGKGGIVTDLEAVEAAKLAFKDWLQAQGWAALGWVPSSIKGSDGNQEWVVRARHLA